MTLQEAKQLFQNQLRNLFLQDEINNFFFLIIEKEFGYNKSKTIMRLDEPLSMGESIMIHGCLNRLKKSEPIQYILGETEFYGMYYKVNRDTLIPRPETEELVDWIISDVKMEIQDAPLRIVDLGTGTGCIAISLARNIRESEVWGWDVSEGALKVARKNAKSNKVHVNFERRDMLKLPEINDKYDIIVSNPPYVRESEKKAMKKNVLDYEPAIALYVPDNDPLVYYKAISRWAQDALKPGGALYFEINEYLGNEVIKLLEQEGFSEIELNKDLSKRDRLVRAFKNE